jgi:Fic family protein
VYSPKYIINNKILKSIGQVEAAKEVIENAPLVPDFVKNFKSEAIVRTVYHGTQIEGNDLTMMQTKQVLEGESVIARERDIQEVINYRNVVSLLDELAASRGGYDVDSMLDVHRAVVDKLVDPAKVGVLRKTQVVIKEEGTGKVIFTPPSPVEVPYLIQDFMNWLNSPEARDIHPVIRAGIAHYVLVTIHPFVEGNGRSVRAYSNLVMIKEGYDIKRFFSIEEHFDRDLSAYYAAFFKVDNQGGDISNRDLTPWLEYFSNVVAIELTKIKEKVRQLSVDSRLRVKIGEQVALSARQMKLIEYMSEHGSAVMNDLKNVLPMVSEDTVLRDLKDLQSKNIIEKEGSTKAARYVLKR